jgi:hypothetical protein
LCHERFGEAGLKTSGPVRHEGRSEDRLNQSRVAVTTSELFVVYNEDRNTSSLGVRGLSTRSIIVKVNRLFRY